MSGETVTSYHNIIQHYYVALISRKCYTVGSSVVHPETLKILKHEYSYITIMYWKTHRLTAAAGEQEISCRLLQNITKQISRTSNKQPADTRSTNITKHTNTTVQIQDMDMCILAQGANSYPT